MRIKSRATGYRTYPASKYKRLSDAYCLQAETHWRLSDACFFLTGVFNTRKTTFALNWIRIPNARKCNKSREKCHKWAYANVLVEGNYSAAGSLAKDPPQKRQEIFAKVCEIGHRKVDKDSPIMSCSIQCLSTTDAVKKFREQKSPRKRLAP